MEGLDELINEIERNKNKINQKNISNNISNNSLFSSSLQTTTTTTTTTTSPKTIINLNKNENNYYNEYKNEIIIISDELRSFILDIADNNVRELVNNSLKTIKYIKFIQYYLENANLSNYSIEAELNRMEFQVIYKNKLTRNKNEVLDIFYETRLDDLWRFANQSVYADLLVAIQHYYNKSELLISTVASTSKLQINFDESYFEACSSFDFVVESDAAPNNRLKLGSIKGSIKINLINRTLEQFVDSPEIPILFDDDIQAAASTILKSYQSNSSQDLLSSSTSSRQSFREILANYTNRVVHSLPLSRQTTSNNESEFQSSEQPNSPNQINVSQITESLLEGVVGSFGRWIGADKQSLQFSNNDDNKSTFEDLRIKLSQNKELTEVNSKIISEKSLVGISSSDNVNNSEEWEEW